MQAVILAGGMGKRLRPLTYKLPKTMVPVNNQPFLLHQIRLIKSYGIKEILILAGYLRNQIQDYFGNGVKLGLKIDYSYENELLGTGGTLKNAAENLNDEFLLLNGDTYLPINYRELISYFYRHKKIGVMTVYNNLNKITSNNLKINKSNLVTDYNKKSNKNMNSVDAGVMVFKKKVIDLIGKDKKVFSLEEEIFPKLIMKKELLAYPTNQRFYDIGTPAGLKIIEEVLK